MHAGTGRIQARETVDPTGVRAFAAANLWIHYFGDEIFQITGRAVACPPHCRLSRLFSNGFTISAYTKDHALGARYTNYVFRVDSLASASAVNELPEPSSLALFGLAGVAIASKQKICLGRVPAPP